VKIFLHTHNLMTRAQLQDTWGNAGADVFTSEAEYAPDLIVIDLTAPAALQQIQMLHDKYPQTEILVFGPHVDGEAFRQAKAAGATSQVARGKVVERVLKQLQQ
jgi:DNA-binding NarL/FixJ family response regulator